MAGQGSTGQASTAVRTRLAYGTGGRSLPIFRSGVRVYRPNEVPEHATVRRIQVDFFHEAFVWTWKTDAGETMAYKMPVTPHMAAEIERYEVSESSYPIPIPNVVFSTPLPQKSVEPPSLFAKRELTEDELLDPGLFCKSVYEPVLDTIVR